MKSTGIFIRINRNGKWVNSDIIDLSNNELITFFEDKSIDELSQWLKVFLEIFLGEFIKNQNEKIKRGVFIDMMNYILSILKNKINNDVIDGEVIK